MSYDVIVLGGGPGGYIAAERAGHAGLKTLLIEKRALGGVCLNEGCVPSKALLNSSKIYNYAAGYGEKYGVSCENARIDHGAVIARKNKVVKTLVAGVGASMKANNVEVVMAAGMIKGKSAEGVEVEAEGKSYVGKNLIVATGSTAVVPPIPGVKEGIEAGFVLTNREVLDLPEIPAKFVVIGGGVIGLEMAAYYGTVGSEVEVVEMLNKIAGPTDAEISARLQKNYEKKGIKFNLGARVTRVDPDGVVFEKDGKENKIVCDKVLLSIGRRAVSTGYGLENLNVLTERGAIVVDETMRTNVAGVYAVGDCNARSMLAHSAYRMGEVAVNNILGKKDIMRFKAIPGVIYTNPEVGTVGLTQEQAEAKGIDAVVVKLPMQYSGRYVAENEGGDGIAKFIFDRKYKTLVGAHVLANYASEFIIACGVMIEKEMTVDAMREIVFPHPTVCEIIREAVWAANL